MWSVAIGFLIVVAIGLVGWVSVWQQKETFTAQIDQYGKAIASQLAGAASEPVLADDRLALEVMLHKLTEQNTLVGAAILPKGKPALVEGLQPPRAEPPGAEGAYTLGWQWRDAMGGKHEARSYWEPISFGDVTAGTVVITLDADSLAKGLDSALGKTAIATLVLISGALAVAVLLIRRLSRPLRTLASLSGKLESGQPLQMPSSGGQTEIDRIVDVFNRLTDGLQEKQRLESLFRCYLPEPLLENLLQDPAQTSLQTQTLEGSVLFCDISRFTALAEPLPPVEVVDLLNVYFGYITLAARSCGGVVDSFGGDSAMIVFGSGERDSLHALHAVTCALLIREVVGRINEQRVARGEPQVWFRIGVNSGPMAMCNLGGTDRMQHTAIGDTVNVASRLCDLGAPGDIILGGNTAAAEGVAERTQLEKRPTQPLHGRSGRVVSFRVVALAPKHQLQLRQTLDKILPIEGA
jgi:adenylate cyclase